MNKLITIKPLWIAALTNHPDAAHSLRSENPAWVSMMARRATLAGLDPKRDADVVAHYFFVVGLSFGDTLTAASTH
jgi:hypothetical protein